VGGLKGLSAGQPAAVGGLSACQQGLKVLTS
jgi:hypothetical protein